MTSDAKRHPGLAALSWGVGVMAMIGCWAYVQEWQLVGFPDGSIRGADVARQYGAPALAAAFFVVVAFASVSGHLGALWREPTSRVVRRTKLLGVAFLVVAACAGVFEWSLAAVFATMGVG